MDVATIIGIIAGIALIVGAILLDGSLLAFANGPGVLIVIGGTIAATLINQKLKYVVGAFSVAMNAFLDRIRPIDEMVNTIHELAQKAKKEGPLGLENVEVQDPFLARGVNLVIDGMEKDFVVSTMRRELGQLQARHQRGQQIFRFMSTTAPAMR